MLVQRGLGLRMPDLALVVGEILPRQTNDLGERAVVCLDFRGDVLTFDERGAE